MLCLLTIDYSAVLVSSLPRADSLIIYPNGRSTKPLTDSNFQEGNLTNLELEQADEPRRTPESIEEAIINLFVQLSPSAQRALLERLEAEYLFDEEDYKQ